MNDDLEIKGEKLISIENAFEYLQDRRVVYELENLYFYYKGFATPVREVELGKMVCDEPFYYEEYDRVYLDGLMRLNEEDKQQFWRDTHEGATFSIICLILHYGNLDGKESLIPFDGFYKLDGNIIVCETNVYVKKSDLDGLSERFGIPKKSCFTKNDLAEGNEEVLNTPLFNNHENEDAHITNFIESVITDFPEAKSKDIVSHCFDCYKSSNRDKSRIKKIIAGLGIEMDKKGGKRNQKSIDYMQGAPKYKPTQ